MKRSDLIAAGVLAAILIFTGAVRMVPGVVGGFNDDAIYASTALSLADGGGYRLHNVPGAPPQTKYPILYPAMMAVASKAASGLSARLAAMQWATLILAGAALGLWYLYLVRFEYCGRAPALASCLLCATAPNFIYYSSAVLSEMPFMLLLVAALWQIERLVRKPPESSRLEEVLIGVLVGLPVICRVIGCALPVAALVLLLLKRRRAGFVAVGSAAVILPWIGWVAAGVGQSTVDPVVGYQTDYLGWMRWTDLSFSWTVVSSNVPRALRAFTHISFEGLARVAYAHLDSAALLMLLVGVVAFAPLVAQFRRALPATCFSLAYLVIVALWPWPPSRFLIPILPLLGALFLQVTERAVLPFGRLPANAAVGAILLAGMITNAGVLADHASTKAEFGYPYFVPYAEPASWDSYEQAFQWLDTHSAPDDVLAAGLDTMTALYTGRATVRTYVPNPAKTQYGDADAPLATFEEFGELLEQHRPRYLLLAPMPSYDEDVPQYMLVSGFARRYPARLRPVWRTGDPRFEILEFIPATQRGVPTRSP